jgi:hypothetical protein
MKFVCLFGAAFVYFLVLGFVICCTDVFFSLGSMKMMCTTRMFV